VARCFPFHGHTDVKELALYAQDTITKGNWAFTGDSFRFVSGHRPDWQPEPRVGVAYNIKKTNSVLRVSYSRVLETPFNENLILASVGAANPVITDVIGGQSLQAPIRFRPAQPVQCRISAGNWGNTRWWTPTTCGSTRTTRYDFSTFGNTPIFFPIAWKSSKIDGPSVLVSMPNFMGSPALVVLAHVRARYFPPQIGGLGTTLAGGEVFRIDHDQAFNQTTHIQYQLIKLALDWFQLAIR